MRRVLVTGAGGFLGRALVRELEKQRPDAHLLLLDQILSEHPAKSDVLEGDFSNPDILTQALAFQPDTVFHLISVPGAAAETDYPLGRRINLDATLDLMQGLAQTGNCSRVVYASSIAVYGELGPAPVTAQTPCYPQISYGTHKRMVELALEDFSRRGEVSSLTLRLPGIVARPGLNSGFGSAFMSELLRSLAAERPYVCPVSPQATVWWTSAGCAARNLLHAAELTQTGTIQLPALWLSVGEVVDALAQLFGEDRRQLVTFQPNQQLEAIFGRYPPLNTPEVEALGFRHDGTAQKLIQTALEAT